MPTETELIQRAMRKDTAAFGQLYELHLESIYRYVYYRVGNAAEATVMVLAGKYERAFGAMIAYDLILRDMARTVNQATARGKDIAPLVLNFQQHVTRQQTALQKVYNNAPPRARPAVQRIINATIDAQNGVLDAIVIPRPAPRPTMTPV